MVIDLCRIAIRATFLAVLALSLSGCSWNGSPKTPVEGAYSVCMKTCGPGGACVADVATKGGWKCLPPAVPVVPAEDGK